MIAENEMTKSDQVLLRAVRHRIAVPGKPKIPKILHQIWTGPNPIPDEYWELRKTWEKHNPDWEVWMWDDEKIDSLNLKNRWVYEKYPQKPILKVDMAKQEIPLRFGGVYADHDMLYLKSFEPFRKHTFFGVFDTPGRKIEAMNFIYGCVPGHRIFQNMVKNTTDKGFDPNGDFVMYFKYFSSYYFDFHVQNVLFYDPKAVIYPPEYLAPFPGANRGELDTEGLDAINKYVTSNTHAVHLWRTTWRKQFA